MGKKKSIGILVICVIALLILLVIGGMILPARHMSDVMQQKEGNISLRINFQEERMTTEQKNFRKIFATVTGVQEENLDSVKLEGTFNEDVVEVKVYSENDVYLTDLQFTEEDCFINVKHIYELAAEHLTEQVALLQYLLPDWSGEEIIPMSKVEETFYVTLQGEKSLPEVLDTITAQMSTINCLGMELIADEKSFYKQEFSYQFLPGDARLATIKEKSNQQIDLQEMPMNFSITMEKDTVTWQFTVEMPEDSAVGTVDGTIDFIGMF